MRHRPSRSRPSPRARSPSESATWDRPFVFGGDRRHVRLLQSYHRGPQGKSPANPRGTTKARGLIMSPHGTAVLLTSLLGLAAPPAQGDTAASLVMLRDGKVVRGEWIESTARGGPIGLV